MAKKWFTPLHPEGAFFQRGDECRAKNKSSRKPRLLRRGVTGFTLIEILLVVVIISALAAMVLPRLTGRSEQAKRAAAKVDITSNIATALKVYELDNGFFPASDQGLGALMKKPSGPPAPRNWNGPYLERLPLDPWGRYYVYKYPGTHGFDYDLYSLGANEKEDADNIGNWD